MNTDAVANGRDDALAARVRDLEARLAESEETLEAIRRGEVDALVVGDRLDGPRVYTLEGADHPYRVLVEQMQEGAVTIGEDGGVLYCNRRFAGMLGVPQEKIVGQRLHRFVADHDLARFRRLLTEAASAVTRSEMTLSGSDRTDIPVYISLSLLSDVQAPILCGVVTDLTEQRLRIRQLADANARLLRESAEREQVEHALRQAQKMEAVGQLTGGIAHDFNNLLTGIIGSLELLALRVGQGRVAEASRYIAAAQKAADRAASLTHRLLAFSRRQTLDPVAIDANRLIAGMEDLIRRSVGPAIAIRANYADGLWTTLCDANQLENAVLNLSINARDAMPDGGTLAISTANSWLDEADGAVPGLSPGDYVAVCVADTGVGMPADIVARAFDPFFTTKPIGMGTGLGLSMIYGFVRQSGGHVRIDSEPGRGTAVHLHLPRHTAAATEGVSLAPRPAAPVRAGASETVLVVDDEPAVRMLVAEVLTEYGYAAIEAADGPAGLEILRSGERIDLLITDVGLPGGLNGRQVADAARALRPALRVLFITGYADAAAVGHGLLDPGMHVITKPFAMAALAGKIRALLTTAS